VASKGVRGDLEGAKQGMRIRIAKISDGQDIADIYGPIVRDTSISFEEAPPSAKEMANRIESTLITHPWLVAEQDGRVVAYAYATQHRTRAAYQWSCDVSVYVGENTRRSGVARALYDCLFAILLTQGFATAFAGIALPNDASVGFHKSMGFEAIGIYRRVGFKNGSWRDVIWWSRTLQNFKGAPPAPLRFSEATLDRGGADK